MKKIAISVLIILSTSISANAETYCQNVNRTGTVVNAAPLAQTTSKWLKKKGVDYKASTQEVTVN